MIDYKCCFSATLITEYYSCEKAQLVTRRGGPDIACASEIGSQRCERIYAHFKTTGLPAFGAEDDLLKTPASIYSKIQYGGLFALSKIIAVDGNQIKSVDNIFQLIRRAEEKYKALEKIPYAELVNSMKTFKIKRHKKTRK